MTKITISTQINSSVEKVWEYYNSAAHIVHWNFASNDWCCPSANVDLKPGGSFNVRMEAKDKSAGFDFTGTYTNIEEYKLVQYKMSDGREVKITFEESGGKTKIEITFDAEDENSIELQQQGWQAILNNFKNYVEGN